MITGKARLAGVMGWPVAHSRSPVLHGHWLQRYGIDGAYVPLAVNPADIVGAVRGLAALGFAGANVTLPHKETMMDIVDLCDERARRIGAINTLIIGDNGQITGQNTDSYGFMAHLHQQYPDWQAPKSQIALIGAGGAARAILDGFLAEGATDILITNRNQARAEALAAHFAPFYPQARFEIVAWAEAPAKMAGAHVLVQTTSLGMEGQPALDFSLDAFDRRTIVCDIVYTPLMTELLIAAHARQMPILDGLGMLLHQAVPGFEAWFGVRPAVDDMLRQTVLGTMPGAR